MFYQRLTSLIAFKEGKRMKKRKILHLITHLGLGGASDNTLLTVKGLSRNRYEVHLAAGQDYTDWIDRGQDYADAFFLFSDLYRSIRPVADIRLLKQLTDFIKANRYDIVHTHNAKAGIVGRIAARRAGVPIIIHTFHLFSWRAAHSFHASSWQNFRGAIEGQLYFQAERYVASFSDMIVTVCELNRREAIELNLTPPDKINTIYSGIDLNRFEVNVDPVEKCRSLGLNPSQPIIGTIGRLSIQKAPLDFVKAAKIVLQQVPAAQFIMVGDGPLASEVHQEIGDEQRIKVLGYRDDVPEILSILDVFALSSLFEGLGRALTEAMIMSVPVVVTAVDGMPELVTHKKTGLLSPPREPARLAENIMWLLDHPEEAERIRQRARNRVVPTFSAERMVEQIEALYERLLVEKEYVEKRYSPLLSS